MALLDALTRVALGYAAARTPPPDPQDIPDAATPPLPGRATDLAARIDSLLATGGDAPGTDCGSGFAGLLARLAATRRTAPEEAARTLAAVRGRPARPGDQLPCGLMLRAMIQAIRSDGRIGAPEQARMLDVLGTDATADDVTFLRTQMAAPVDPVGLAADTPPEHAAQVYAMALTAIAVDTAEEHRFLATLAGALALPPDTVARLHAEMGAPAPDTPPAAQ